MFIVLAIISISYDNIALIKSIAEVWKQGVQGAQQSGKYTNCPQANSLEDKQIVEVKPGG